jgi:hypothetical protein
MQRVRCPHDAFLGWFSLQTAGAYGPAPYDRGEAGVSPTVRPPLVGGFAGILTLVREHTDECTKALERYFSGAPSDPFTGRRFEHFSALSNPLHLDANDIAACGSLSVPLTGKAIDGLLGNAARIDELLERCPARSETLWEVDPTGPEYRALDELYGLVRGVSDVGYVTASKLLACKRPHLVPIRDQVVETLLGSPEAWWAPWRTALTPELVGVTEALGGDDLGHVSVLRKLDVVLWMYGKGERSFDTMTA